MKWGVRHHSFVQTVQYGGVSDRVLLRRRWFSRRSVSPAELAVCIATLMAARRVCLPHGWKNGFGGADVG
jgi:hypothetical protein